MTPRERLICKHLRKPMTADALAGVLGVSRLTAYRALQGLVIARAVYIHGFETTPKRGPRARRYKVCAC